MRKMIFVNIKKFYVIINTYINVIYKVYKAYIKLYINVYYRK